MYALSNRATASRSRSNWEGRIKALTSTGLVQLRSYQFVYYRRCNEIEKYFRGELQTIHPHQIGAAWDLEWERRTFLTVFRIMAWPNVLLPHAVIVVMGAGLYYLGRVGLIANS